MNLKYLNSKSEFAYTIFEVLFVKIDSQKNALIIQKKNNEEE